MFSIGSSFDCECRPTSAAAIFREIDTNNDDMITLEEVFAYFDTQDCVFPFKYALPDGTVKEYTSCTTDDDEFGFDWCPSGRSQMASVLKDSSNTAKPRTTKQSGSTPLINSTQMAMGSCLLMKPSTPPGGNFKSSLLLSNSATIALLYLRVVLTLSSI